MNHQDVLLNVKTLLTLGGIGEWETEVQLFDGSSLMSYFIDVACLWDARHKVSRILEPHGFRILGYNTDGDFKMRYDSTAQRNGSYGKDSE